MSNQRALAGLLGLLALSMFVGELLVVIPSLNPEIQWSKIYSGTPRIMAFSADQTSDGGYIIAGQTAHNFNGSSYAWLVKADSDGNMQWNKTYGGSGSYEVDSVQQTSDRGYIFIGSISGSTSNTLIWLVKLDQNGNIQWSKGYQSAEAGRKHSLQQTLDGGYLIAGYGYWGINNSLDSYIWLAKTDPNGDLQWNTTYSNVISFMAGPFLQITSDGGCIVAGGKYFSTLSERAALLIKWDKNGKIQWNKTYGGSWVDWASSVLQTSDGGYVFAGSYSPSGTLSDLWLVKTDANGTLQWGKAYGKLELDIRGIRTGSQQFSAFSVETTLDGGYIILGGFVGEWLYGTWLMKTDSNGSIQWMKDLQNSSSPYGYEALSAWQAIDGGYMVAGFASDPNFRGGFWLVKMFSSPPLISLVEYVAGSLTVALSGIACFAIIDRRWREK